MLAITSKGKLAAPKSREAASRDASHCGEERMSRLAALQVCSRRWHMGISDLSAMVSAEEIL